MKGWTDYNKRDFVVNENRLWPSRVLKREHYKKTGKIEKNVANMEEGTMEV